MVWAQTILLAVVGNLLLRMGALTIFDIPPEFPPLAMPGPTIFFSVIGVGAWLAVALLVGRSAAEPVRSFRRIAIAALLVSLVPDLWMLTDAAAEAFPGATLSAVVTLMLEHVLTAVVVVVWMLTVRAPRA